MKNYNAKAIITLLLADDVSDDTKIKLLSEIQKYGNNIDILYDLVKIIKKTQTICLSYPHSFDIVGTGWSLLPRFNTSTTCAFILSRAGIPVLKHWSNASTGRVGSFDLLEHMQYHIPQTIQEINHCIQNQQPVFLYARLFFPLMKTVANARKEYGKPTLFNILWPLLNPADSWYQLIGCSFQDKMDMMIQVCKKIWKKRVCVVRGDDGLDDVTVTTNTQVYMLNHNHITKHCIDPSFFGLRATNFDEITWGDTQYNTHIMQSILNGTCKTKHLDLVLANCALALFIYHQSINLDHPDASKIIQWYVKDLRVLLHYIDN